MTYEFDQTFIAESFQALYVERDRLSLGRGDLSRRYEHCEDLAQHLAESLSVEHFAHGLSTEEVLARCLAGLKAPESGVREHEAAWVTRRAAELLGWNAPDWLLPPL